MKYQMEFSKYTNFFYYFLENIKIPILRKREQIKKNNCIQDAICYRAKHELLIARTPQNGRFYKRREYENNKFFNHYEMDHCNALSNVIALNLWSFK